ncbi:unnamed protein product [Linum trigynum]|uniref:Uncharacterized protein n=1 Tax=Linum trigynum TaxID=586398 RepID=A0AAV2D4L3_9ROSI
MAAAAAAAAPKNRRTMDYDPTVWGDFFLTHVPQTDEVVKAWEEQIEVLKPDVKRRLSAPIDHLAERLNLIDVVERLGLDYHFEEEIDHIMRQVHQNNHGCNNIDEDDELNTVALRFRLLRQHGYKAPSDVFNKFKTEGGVFKEDLVNDFEGMLNLYEAGYLRIKGEGVLDEAIEFTRSHLTAKAAELESPLADRVTRALKRPLRKVMAKCEHLFFISFYEKLVSHDPTLLKLAKLSFNVLQNLYQTELRTLTKWWLELDTPANLPYARDKLVESYLWALGGLWEPKYSVARQLVTKVTQFGTLMDDTFDNQGCIEELELFTAAMAGWDSSMEGLKPYMMVLFEGIAEIYAEIVSHTTKERGVWYLDYGKREVGNAVRLYLEEEKRTDKDYVATVEEYRQVSSLTTCYEWITYSAFCGFGDDLVSKDAFEWLLSEPTMLIAATDQCRLQDDIADHLVHDSVGDPSDHDLSMSLLKGDEKEQKATLLECYMKQYDVSQQEAAKAVADFIEEDWMIMNEEMLNPPPNVPVQILTVLLRFAKNMDTLYKDYDGYTHSGTNTKDMITALIVTPRHLGEI